MSLRQQWMSPVADTVNNNKTIVVGQVGGVWVNFAVFFLVQYIVKGWQCSEQTKMSNLFTGMIKTVL